MSDPIDEGIQSAPPVVSTSAESLPPLPKGPWGFWATIGFSVAIARGYVGGQIIAIILYSAFTFARNGNKDLPPFDQIETNGDFLGLGLIISAPFAVGLTLLFAWLRRGPSLRDYLGLHWPPVKSALKWVVVFVGLMLESDCLTTALGRPIVPKEMIEIYRNTSFLPLLWVGACIAAPLSEEFFFRGFLFRGSRPRVWAESWLFLFPPQRGQLFTSSMMPTGLRPYSFREFCLASCG